MDEEGYLLEAVRLPREIAALTGARDWVGLDRTMRAVTSPGGAVFEAMRRHASFREIEYIISIRSSREHPDEDGIWHDDGSRVRAFSLSLTEDPATVEGGRLELRRRFDQAGPVARIPTPPFGTMIVFATGHGGFEHRILRVTGGERIIIAGWCS